MSTIHAGQDIDGHKPRAGEIWKFSDGSERYIYETMDVLGTVAPNSIRKGLGELVEQGVKPVELLHSRYQ